MQTVRALLRPARMIHAAYAKVQHRLAVAQSSTWTRLERWMNETRQLKQGLQKAQSHRWKLAAAEMQRRLAAALTACGDAARAMHADCQVPIKPIPSLDTLLAELEQLYAEFDTVRIDTKRKTVSIQTDPIVLEEVALGPFLVRLNWLKLPQPTIECFDIKALKPNLPSGDDRVPHPHVRSEKLCAGEATVPLQRALEQGRLVDAFHLIWAVLTTYNAESAYVALSDWEGVSCWNCSSSTTLDNRSFCEGCDHDICDDCLSSCKHCDRSRCSSCIGLCEDCDSYCCLLCLTKSALSSLLLCKDCLHNCDGCEAKVAAKELDRHSKLCPACQDAQSDEEADREPDLLPSLEGYA